MMEFAEAFERLIGHEGVLSLDPNDRGNWTGGKAGVGVLNGSKYGISAAAYPKLDIAGITLADAQAIYLRDYWKPHSIDQMPAAMRFDVFDGVVNSGPGSRRLGRDGAIRWLQRAAGVADDGIVGAQTIAAVRGTDPLRLLARYNGLRLDYMTRLDAWPTQGRGWARRVAKNLMEV